MKTKTIAPLEETDGVSRIPEALLFAMLTAQQAEIANLKRENAELRKNSRLLHLKATDMRTQRNEMIEVFEDLVKSAPRP